MDKKSKKYFIVSMLSTLYALFLMSGLVIVEKNARNTILKENPPFLSYKTNDYRLEFIKIHFMGKDYVFNFEKKVI